MKRFTFTRSDSSAENELIYTHHRVVELSLRSIFLYIIAILCQFGVVVMVARLSSGALGRATPVLLQPVLRLQRRTHTCSHSHQEKQELDVQVHH